MKKKISRLAATLLVMVLMATVFTGCDKKASTHETALLLHRVQIVLMRARILKLRHLRDQQP